MTHEEIVRAAEAAYTSQDLARVRALFDPDVVVWWDGVEKFHGVEEVIAFESANFASWTGFRIAKTLLVADGDKLAVEWDCSFVPKATGKRMRVLGAEFWKLRNGRLIEWRAWSKNYDA